MIFWLLAVLAAVAVVGLAIWTAWGVGRSVRAIGRNEVTDEPELADEWDASQADEFLMPHEEAVAGLAAMDGKRGTFAKAYAAASTVDGGDLNRADRRAIARGQRKKGR